MAPPKETLRFLPRRGTPRRYVLREMGLPVRTDLQEDPYKERLTPYESFAAVSLLEYGGLNPILPVLRRT